MQNKVQIIDGKKIAEKIKDEIALEVFNIKDRRPSLAIILVGNRPDSELYVSLKEREAKKVGLDAHLYRLEAESTEQELLEVIEFLNNDEAVDAILLQLPLPANFQTDKIIAAINPLKDADGFHLQHPDYVLSPVISAVDYIARQYKIKTRACVFYRSDIFGQSLKKHLEKLGLEVDLLAVKEGSNPKLDLELKKELSAVSVKADFIVSALGLPHFLDADYLRSGVVIVDVGITKENEQICGDVNFLEAAKVAQAITPVPGGVGPMTIAFLFKNVLAIYKNYELKNL